MSRWAISLIASAVALCGGCNDFGYVGRELTASERAKIEAAVRDCGLPVYDARWARIQDGQWEFGFATDEAVMQRRPNAATNCVSAVSEDILAQDLNVSIGYYGR